VSKAELTLGHDGMATLSGTLDFISVPEVWSELKLLLEQRQISKLSLKDVNTCNSAALALLVEAKAAAGDDFSICDLPNDLQDLAKMSNLLPLLQH